MSDYMPDFERLMDTSEPGSVDEPSRRFAGFFTKQETLEMVAAGVHSGAGVPITPKRPLADVGFFKMSFSRLFMERFGLLK